MLLTLLDLTLASAEEKLAPHWDCSLKGRGDRIFDLVYHQAGKDIPCQVNYRSLDTPDEIQVLWQAEVQRNYCEKMLSKRLDELKRQGWNCVPRQAS